MVAEKKVRKYESVELGRHDEAMIVLPDEMALRDGASWLLSMDKEENEPYAIYEPTNAHPLDGAHALAMAVAETFGHARTILTPGMWGSTPPMFIDVPLDANGKSVKVPWGRIELPGIKGYLESGLDLVDGRPVFVLTGEVLKKHRRVIDTLTEKMRETLASSSIYRNSAIKVSQFVVDQRLFTGNPTHYAPMFLDVSGLSMANVIFNRDIEAQIEDYVLTPIRNPDGAKAVGVPTKRGILMHGTYGVGKSLTSRVLASEALAAGYTFIYIDKAENIELAYRMAMDYQPCVLFVEDVDKVASGDRDADMDAVLNMLDGIETKLANVVTVFTTNDLRNIHQAFERPGRIDVIIEMKPPNAEAATRLVRLYAGELLDPSTDYDAIGQVLDGSIPALILEAVNRAKLSALRRSGSADKLMITADDILRASRSLETARDLLKQDEGPDSSVLERIGKGAFGAMSHEILNNGTTVNAR